MAAASDVQKDIKIDSDGSTTTGINKAVTTNMTQSDVHDAHEAATVSAINQPLIDLGTTERLEGTATKDGEAVADRDTNDNREAGTTAQVSIAGQTNFTGQANLTGQVVPANPNLLRRLPIEYRMQIYDLVIADGVPGTPDPIPGEEKFTRTLKLPAITMVDHQTRDETVRFLLLGKQFSVQLPRDEGKTSSMESLQERVMNRHRGGLRFDSDEILGEMKQHAKETEDEFYEYLSNAQDLELCPFHYVGSLIVTYNGRVRLNVDDGTSNWSPRSLLVGFRCYDEVGFESWKNHKNEKRQLNAAGALDWTNFHQVRKAFVAALLKADMWFTYVPYVDVLLHPMIQHLVKALCMFASGQKKPLRWVEVIAFEFISIPQGLGVEWSSLTYKEAIYESEPDDGYGCFPDGRFLSGDEESQDGSEENSDGGSDEEQEEDEDEDEEDSSDNAARSENGKSSDGRDDLHDDENSEGDHVDQTEVVKTQDEADENPAVSNEFEGGKHSESRPEGF
ncbi:hypothetical protein UCDDA912_g05239 [Diaporthe ampelina]|uniref:Uncharacterized protein n=1 Tax=Diaporthe ampelina TaxID=1214573 RepID=A0A0G2FK75_9PEZI|nr:hypothetical protein UCDDA912_g05239 [Diaporthe ampelina]